MHEHPASYFEPSASACWMMVVPRKESEGWSLYTQHIGKVLRTTGYTQAAAAQAAGDIERIERHSLSVAPTPVEAGEQVPKLLSRAELQCITPSFDWTALFAGLGTPHPAKKS